jgi:LuxR family maltose regulon positive regulatory protein
LILVNAPAGYGKSTVVSAWVQKTSSQVAWFSIDRNDNDLPLFLAYLITALQNTYAGFGQFLLNALTESGQIPWERILTELTNELANLADPTILILDDYHLIESQEIHQAMIFLLDHLPANTKILIISRIEPPFPLYRWRGQGILSEIRAADLRFTLEETRGFFAHVMGLRLHPEDVKTLENRTEGWITGLQMAALAIQSLPTEPAQKQETISEFIRSFSSSHRYLLDYLQDEVIARQPQYIQTFLMQTSVLERMTAPLCDAVTGNKNSQEILDHLESHNLFLIPLDGERRWYRYHHLFSELLENSVRKNRSIDIIKIHLRASTWYEQQGYADEAIHHALASQKMDVAVDLLEKLLLDLVERDEVELGRYWLRGFPNNVIQSRPLLCLAQSVAVQYEHPFVYQEEMERWARFALQASSELLAQPIQSTRIPYKTIGELVTVHMASLRTYLAGARGESPDAIIRMANLALDAMSPEDAAGRSWMTMTISRAHMLAGDTMQAEQTIQKALKLAKHSGKDDMQLTVRWVQSYVAYRQGRYRDVLEIYARAYDDLIAPAELDGRFMSSMAITFFFWGTVLVEFNQLSEAKQYIQKGLALAQLRDNFDTELDAEIGLTWLEIYRGKDDRIAKLKKYPLKLSQIKTTMVQSHIIQMQVFLANNYLNNLQASYQWIDQQASQLTPLAELQPLYLIWVQTLLLRKSRNTTVPDLNDLIAPLKKQYQFAKAGHFLRHQVRISIIQALVYQALGDMDAAIQAISEALYLSEPERYVRSFINEGEPIIALLQAAVDRAIVPFYAKQLLAALKAEMVIWAAATVPKSGGSLVEPPTPRELDVLKLVAAGLSNRQIAEQLVLAPGTVKKYLSNVYQKLNVNRRTQAVARAKELGFLR